MTDKDPMFWLISAFLALLLMHVGVENVFLILFSPILYPYFRIRRVFARRRLLRDNAKHYEECKRHDAEYWAKYGPKP